MKRSKVKLFFVLTFVEIFVLATLVACQLEETDDKKIKNLDYTICDEGKLPDELITLIQERKKETFKLTYRTKDYLYIVVGYGAQDRTDLSVKMLELYMTKNAIFVNTDLKAEEDTTLEDNKVSYPWLAIKCEHYDLPVNFK